jgi:ketosteroid isomerase-like protein
LTTLTAGPEILARLTFSDLDVRITGTVALVRAAFTAEFHAHTGRTQPDRGISTLVFFYRQGHWRLRHQHNSHNP